MDKSKLKETKNHITYQIRTDFHNRDYDMPKRRLNEIRVKHESHIGQLQNVSEWIAHLSEKAWANRKLLTELSGIIKRLHPENKIDWVETQKIIDNLEGYSDKPSGEAILVTL